MTDQMIGTIASANDEPQLLREAGIEWVRHGVPFPFTERVGGEVSDSYPRARAGIEKLVEGGFQVLGVTPGLGAGLMRPDQSGRLKSQWHDRLPAWCRPLGSDEFYRIYEETCRWLAEDLRGLVAAWQIGNELDWRQFRGPLDLRQVGELILRAGRALKETDPSLVLGTNTGGTERAYYLYGRLFAEADGPLDYCGVDHYYGTWQRGAPEDWADEIAEIHAITQKPVLINEWGFASAGEGITEEERRSGRPVCELKKWRFTWGPGHTPEGQAEFIRRAFDAFCEQRDALLGIFYFRWRDTETCWQCGEPDCPAETAWGVVDVEGRPKPSFDALKDGIARLRAR